MEIVKIESATDGYISVEFAAFSCHKFEVFLKPHGEDTLALILRTIPVMMELDAQIAMSFDRPSRHKVSISHVRLVKRFFEMNTFRNLESVLFEYVATFMS
jgi:hypothetical protein